MKQRFVAFKNAGQGGLWMYLWAESIEAIEQKFPEFWAFSEPPIRFSNDPLARRCAERLESDIDQPAEWLARYIRDEQRNDYIYNNPSAKPPFVDT